MRRYRVTQRPPEWRQEVRRHGEGVTPVAQRPWVIFDAQLKGYCTLPPADEGANVLPLEWHTADGARAWLMRCYRTWGRVPVIGGDSVPYDIARERVGQ